ncbi:MAG: hypothetical protein HQK63_04580 [Desulfamplus sp.]|nr:hypothetical protein [Desulfamplus sp.]
MIKKTINNPVFIIFMFLYCFIILFININSYANAMDNTKDSTIFAFENIAKDVPEGLIEQIKLYWQHKANKDLKSAYAIESPHIKYQLPFEVYENYHKKARKLNGCKILNIENSSLGRYYVRIQISFDDKEKPLKTFEESQVINELWIELNGKWYHVYVNPFANIH